MTINVKVQQNPSGGFVQTSSPITLRNTIQNTARLDGLFDVNPDTAETPDGSTLVYDSATDKYTVKLLDLDGGNF